VQEKSPDLIRISSLRACAAAGGLKRERVDHLPCCSNSKRDDKSQRLVCLPKIGYILTMNNGSTMQQALQNIFYQCFGAYPNTITALKGDGSDRHIFRLKSGAQTVIGISGSNFAENEAFVSFTNHFEKHGLPVPHIYCYDASNGLYLEKDLGDVTLFDWLALHRTASDFEQRRSALYRRVLEYLPRFQIQAGQSIDFSRCYQTPVFESDAMLKDLLYFKQSFLTRFAAEPWDKESLLEDFHTLIHRLLEQKTDYFLYRDFQSRNIMLNENEPSFIDYQSGRRGALQYDLASLLYDAKASLPQELREELLEKYLEEAMRYAPIQADEFKRYFYDFALIRVLQALAAFSFLAHEKGKTYFLQSIPFGLANFGILLHKSAALRKMDELRRIFCDDILANDSLTFLPQVTNNE
jgi:aminoglycoside/choline kinase family phosphotransferase